MNSENSKTSKLHVLTSKLADQLNLGRDIALANLSIYYTWKNIKKIIQQ